MFTLNIRHIVLVGKGRMKWENNREKARENLLRDDSVADLLKKAELAHEEIQKFQGESDPDAIKISRAVEQLEKILAKIDPKNKADRTAVLNMLTVQVSEAPDGSDSQTALLSLLKKFDEEYSTFDHKKEELKEEVKENIKGASTRVFESVVQKNSREIQARDFTEYVASKLADPLKTQFFDAVTKKDDMGNITYLLNNVSIPNLIRSVTEGTVYIADGAEFNDRQALGKFMEVYSTNTEAFDTILKPLAIAANAGQSVESIRKSGTLKDSTNKSNIIQYLAKVDNFETQGTTALDRQLSAATVFLLDSIKGDNTKFFDVLTKAAKLGGYEGEVNQANISDPSLKYSILAGIRQSSRLPGGIDSLRDTKSASGIGENERKVLAALDKDKTKLLDGLKDGFQKQLANQIKDGTIPAEKSEEAQKAIDAYIADMKTAGSPGWNIISKNLGAAITNRGAGVAVGATMDFPHNWLADNVSLGIGFSTGKPGIGVGITFEKGITQDTKILYGWAGVPFVGMTTQFDKWHFTGIGGAGGGLLNVSRDMGNKDTEVKNMEGMKSADKILSQIDGLATGDKKAKNITFEQDVSGYPETSDNPMEPTQSRMRALNAAINTDIQNRLSVAGFDTEKNPIVRSQMIYNALTQAIQSRIDLLHLDDATGGWSLKSLGLTLGSFAGVPFILPSISFGRTSYTQSVKLEKRQKNQGSTLASAKEVTPGIDPIQTKFDSLDKVASVNTLLTKKETRIALSHLWNNSARNKEVNAFAKSLQSFQMGEMVSIEDGKKAFLTLTKGLPELVAISRVITGITDPQELQAALFDIRGAMMMDENQARTLTIQAGITINESPAATKKRFNDILASNKTSPLLEKMGLTKADFAGVVNKVGDTSSKLSMTDPKPRLVGAVASLKTSEQRMDIMPAGTMRFAQNDDNIEFIKDASNFDPSKKAKMYDAILPKDSLSEGHLRKNIATILQQGAAITSVELKALMVDGKASIGGKDVSMTGQKFYLGAYGDCTNPCIALEPGTISVSGTPGIPVTADEPEYNMSTGSRADVVGLTGAIGWAGQRPIEKPKKEEPKPEDKKPETKTTPESGEPKDMGKTTTNTETGPITNGTSNAQGTVSSTPNTTPAGNLTLGSTPTGVAPRPDVSTSPTISTPVQPNGVRPR